MESDLLVYFGCGTIEICFFIGGAKMSRAKRARLKTWERFNSAASAEKEWMNTRLNWLFTSQTILIAALAFIVKDTGTQSRETMEFLKNVISWTGLFVSFFVLIGVLAAGVMHWKWTSKLNKLAKKLKSNGIGVSFGSKPHLPARTSSVIPSLLALVFVAVWLAIICQLN